MMRLFRKHMRALLWTITIVVSITFVGAYASLQTMGGPPPVGTVLGEKISMQELRKFSETVTLGPSPRSTSDWETLFHEYALLRLARKTHLPKPPIEEQPQELPGVPRDRWQRMVEHFRYRSLLRSLIRDSALPSTPRLYRRFLEERGSRRGRYVRFPVETFAKMTEKAAEPSEEELRAFYDRHAGRTSSSDEPGYLHSASVRFEYLFIARDRAAAGIEPTDEEIEHHYTQHPERWRTEAVATASEEQPPPPTARPLPEVRGEIVEALRTEQADRKTWDLLDEAGRFLDYGDSLPEVASRLGLDHGLEGPVPRGTEWKSETLGTLEAETIDRIFDAQENTVSSAETSTGKMLFRLRERIPEGPIPFEEARPRVLRDWIARKAREEAERTAWICSNAGLTAGLEQGLAAASERLKADFPEHEPDPPPAIETSVSVTKGGDPAEEASYPEPFIAALFELAAPQASQGPPSISKPIYDPKGDAYYVIALDTAQPPDPAGFSEYHREQGEERTWELGGELVELMERHLLEAYTEFKGIRGY
jgi:hypothetical protein